MDWDIADGLVWSLVIIGGPLLIGIFMFVFSRRRRRLTRNEQTAVKEATRDNWGKEQIR